MFTRSIGYTELIVSAAAVVLAAQAAPARAHSITERVSLGPRGVQGNDYSLNPSISADGRFVAFTSYASTLVPGDSNATGDVFVRDRLTRTTSRVSVGPGGAQANEYSQTGTGYGSNQAISADGRFVVFVSAATNLVPGDTNGFPDMFVRDRVKGTTRRMSLGPGGTQANEGSLNPAISADGRFAAFSSYATNLVRGDINGASDVFVRDRVTGTTQRVSLALGGSQGNYDSHEPAISADGRFVAFLSYASNLVPGDTNGQGDVFVRDRKTATTRRVSVGPRGIQANAFSDLPVISADGRFVAFFSEATNLVPGDTNGTWDVFIRDRVKETTRRVSVGPGGVQGNRSSYGQAISADGRFVAFRSAASNFVPGDTNGFDDVFVRDRLKGTTRRVSLGPGGVQGNDGSGSPAISADGRFVAFDSGASNVVPGDTNGFLDVFVRIPAP